ncbi:hypothetical protein BJV82DRAFT_537931 [Fennellomyces sp. T-0311]|nr:hypothetical protein BJV82DRAFT_537931 [Fennellomyces sp. T-0311]
MPAANSYLFRPIKIGAHELKHRIVMCPLTRLRSDEDRVPTPLVGEYYEQRATEGGLLITEATLISPMAGGYTGAPAIYSDKQIKGWKHVTDRVHAKGGVIFLQLWHLGRTTAVDQLPQGQRPVAPSAIAVKGDNLLAGAEYPMPRALETHEIKDVVNEYAQAAKNAIKAGFDGVEIHAANGYLIDQFINTSSNKRTDQYGGSIENRTRFCLEVVQEVTKAVGEERTSIRLSPWSGFQDMCDDTPYDTWGYIIDQLRQKHPNMAYVHFIEPREDYIHSTETEVCNNTLDPFRQKWDGPFCSAGGYTSHPDLAAKVADGTGNLIAFGRLFIANPDLVARIKNGWPLNKYHRETFYTHDAVGYTDYPFYNVAK